VILGKITKLCNLFYFLVKIQANVARALREYMHVLVRAPQCNSIVICPVQKQPEKKLKNETFYVLFAFPCRTAVETIKNGIE
jgi:hypothetical protein